MIKNIIFSVLLLIYSLTSAQPSQIKWQFKSANAFVASPVIDNGIIYIGGTDSSMYALDANTGNVKWKYKTGGEIRSACCVNGDQLIFISSSGLHALSKITGKPLKTYPLDEKQSDIYDYTYCTPQIYEGRIYVGSSDSYIYVFNPEPLIPIWNSKVGGPVHTRFAFGAGKLYAGSFDGYVYALDCNTGQLVWKFKSLGHDYFPKGEMQFPPTYANGRVYIGGRDYNLYCLDAERGFCHWNRAFPEGWVTTITPSPRTDSVLLVATSDPQVLVCVNGIEGSDIWKTNIKANVFGDCVCTKDEAYVGTSIGKVLGIDLHTGVVRSTFVTENYTQNHLNYLKEDDSFRSDIEEVAKKGHEDYISISKNLGAIFSTPLVTNNFIIIACMNGTIYCLNKTKDGIQNK